MKGFSTPLKNVNKKVEYSGTWKCRAYNPLKSSRVSIILDQNVNLFTENKGTAI